jgi:hypothetical protein
MKKIIQILFTLAISILTVNAQGDISSFQRKKVNLDKASFLIERGKFLQADTIYKRLNSDFPNDSFVMFQAGKAYCMFGSTNADTVMLNYGIFYMNKMSELYPQNKLYGLYIAFANIRKADMMNFTNKSDIIALYEVNIRYIEDNAEPFLKTSDYNQTARYFLQVAKEALEALNNVKNGM